MDPKVPISPGLRLLRIDGVALELRHIAAAPGAPAKAPLVFLHEDLGSVSLWRVWPAKLCVAPAHCASAWPLPRRTLSCWP